MEDRQIIPIKEFHRSSGEIVEGREIPSLAVDGMNPPPAFYFASREQVYNAVRDFEISNNIPRPVIAPDGSYEDKDFLYAAYDEYVGMSHRQELAAYADRFPNLASDESLDAYLAQIYYAKANGLSELRIESLIAEANQDGDPYQLEHLSDARLRMEHTYRSARNEVPKQRDSVREKLKSQPVKNSPNYSANFSKGQER